jgi:hypothetical protein
MDELWWDFLFGLGQWAWQRMPGRTAWQNGPPPGRRAVNLTPALDYWAQPAGVPAKVELPHFKCTHALAVIDITAGNQ